MFQTDKEYRKLALILLNGTKNEKLLTEENIGKVMYWAMKADEKFDGNGSRDGFRVYYAKFGIKKILQEIKENKKRGIQQSVLTQYQINKAVSDKSYQSALINEILDWVKNTKEFNDVQKNRFLSYFVQGKTEQEIADEDGVTRNAVSISIIKIKTRLKEIYG